MAKRRAVQDKANRLTRWADGVIGIISPATALKRQQYRAAAQSTKFNHYARSAHDRTRADWYSVQGSADAEILPDLPGVRGRSRELVSNDSMAASIVQTLVDNTVGTGIRAQSAPDRRMLNVSDEQVIACRTAAEERWQVWSNECEFTGRHDLHSLMRLVTRQWI